MGSGIDVAFASVVLDSSYVEKKTPAAVVSYVICRNGVELACWQRNQDHASYALVQSP